LHPYETPENGRVKAKRKSFSRQTKNGLGRDVLLKREKETANSKRVII